MLSPNSAHLRRSGKGQVGNQQQTELSGDNRMTATYTALVKIFLEKGDCL